MMHSLIRSMCLILLLTVPAIAQDDVGNLTVVSSPVGTVVTLEGEYQLAGVTPVTYNQNLIGMYRLTAYRDGYEKYKTTLVLVGDEPFQIDFEMVPKTPFKAAFRSLVVPGWGQMYTDQKLRGALYTSATVISLMSLLIADQDFRDKRDTYNEVRDLYESTRSIDEMRIIRERLDTVQKEAYDAETVRQIAFGVTAFVWAFNVLDAIVFFPDRRHTVGGPPSITLDTGSDFDRLGLRLAVTF
jgi:hypothetical protein